MALDPRIAELEENLRQWERRNGRRLVMATLLPILVVAVLGWYAFSRIEQVEGPVNRLLDSLAVQSAEDPSARLGLLAQEVRRLRDQASRATAAEQRRADANRELDQLRSGVDGAREDLERKVQEATDQLAQAQSARDVAVARAQQLQTSLAAATGTSGQAAGRIGDLERTVAMVTSARDLARSRAAELETTMAATMLGRNELAAKLDAAANRTSELQDQLAAQQAKASDLGAHVAQLEARLTASEQKAARAEDRASAAEQAARQQAAAAAATPAPAQSTASLESEMARSEGLRQQIALLEEQLREASNQRSAAEGKLAAMASDQQKTRTSDDSQQLRQLQDQAQALRQQLDAALADAAAAKQAASPASRAAPLVQLEASLEPNAAGGQPAALNLDAVVLNDGGMFAPGSDVLSTSGRAEVARIAGRLRRLVEVLPASRPWRIRIDGHTDDLPIRAGRFSSNWSLSSARASSVAAALVADGLPPSRLMAAGFADTKPVTSAGTDEARRLNRRIEIRVVDP